MKKIGIITLNGYFNYGNRLQNFALHKALELLGYKVETIVSKPIMKKNTLTNYIYKLRSMHLKILIKRAISKVRLIIRSNIEKKMFGKVMKERIMNFRRFTKNYIPETNHVIDAENIPENLSDSYDYFVIGSDQVWNPHYRKGSEIDFLTFTSPQKRIAFAASFGVDSIPDIYKEEYTNGLKEIPNISVREDKGAEIIKNLINRNIEVIIDPTLMLDKEEWLKISKKAEFKPSRKYLLAYFLGKNSDEVLNAIDKLASECDLEIVKLASKDDALRYTAGPDEFIEYINNAEIILTDSYHGIIFSILFERPFIAFNRIGSRDCMFSRVETLLSKFNLENRKWDYVKTMENIFYIDYSHVPGILRKERSKALNYLKNAMS